MSDTAKPILTMPSGEVFEYRGSQKLTKGKDFGSNWKCLPDTQTKQVGEKGQTGKIERNWSARLSDLGFHDELDALIDAACEVVNAVKYGHNIEEEHERRLAKLTAALEPFTREVVRSRFFYMEPCAYIEDRETTRRYDLTDYKQVIELNDLLNTLSKSQGES